MTDHFKEKAQDWDKKEGSKKRAGAITKAIQERITFDSDSILMDFGAGTGLLSEPFAPLVKKIIAVDTSEAMLKQLKKKPVFNGKLQTVNKDIVTEPLNTQVDIIISSMSMHHVEDVDGLIHQFAELLPSAGQIALADLDKEDGSFHDEGTEGVHHHGFDRKDFQLLLEKHRFEEIQFTTVYTMTHDDGKEFPIFLVTAAKK